jgi:non-specific serine/threonine protein kinase
VLDFGQVPQGAPANTANLKWRAVRDAPEARQFGAYTVDEHSIWIFGGLGEDTSTSTANTMAYDPAIDTWKSGPKLPLPVHHAMAVTYKGDPVVIGGWVPSGANLTAQTSNRVFALRNGAWEELPKLNHARAGGAAAVVGDKIIVVAGQAGGKLVAPTEVFDGKTWKDAADIPTPRDHLAGASDGKYLYAVGGRNLSADKNTGALERYDPSGDSWKKLPSMPTPSGGLGAAIVAGRLVAVGGETPTSVLDAVQSFDLRTNKWSKLPPIETPRHGVAVAAIGNSLYVLTGAEETSHSGSTPTAEVLDFK